MPPTDPQTPEPIRPRRRWFRRIALGVVVLGAALVLFNAAAYRLVARYEHVADRDPDTGILAGAEPRTLGPAEAPVAVILVHGYLGGSSNFADLPERLAGRGWRVRAVRLPGHGTSPRDLEGIPVVAKLDAVLEEVAAARQAYPRVVLVGHSMGGALCTLAAARGEVDGLVLAAPYFGVTHRWYYGLRPETWAKLASPVVPWVYKGRLFICVNRPEAKKTIFSYRWVSTRSMTRLVELAGMVNAPEVLDNVTCPILWLHPRRDRAASPEAAARAVAAMASSHKRTVWLEASDHHVFWDYDRETVADEIEAFISGLVQGAE